LIVRVLSNVDCEIQYSGTGTIHVRNQKIVMHLTRTLVRLPPFSSEKLRRLPVDCLLLVALSANEDFFFSTGFSGLGLDDFGISFRVSTIAKVAMSHNDAVALYVSRRECTKGRRMRQVKRRFLENWSKNRNAKLFGKVNLALGKVMTSIHGSPSSVSISTIFSPIAILAVNPGDSIPIKFTKPFIPGNI